MDVPAILSDLIARAATPQQTLDAATASLREGLQAHLVTVLVPADGSDFLLRAGSGMPGGHVGQQRLAGGEGSSSEVACRHRWVILFDDLQNTGRFAKSDLVATYSVVSSMAVALRDADDRVLGVLGAHARERRTFTPTEIALLERTAAVIADVLAGERASDIARGAAR